MLRSFGFCHCYLQLLIKGNSVLLLFASCSFRLCLQTVCPFGSIELYIWAGLSFLFSSFASLYQHPSKQLNPRQKIVHAPMALLRLSTCYSRRCRSFVAKYLLSSVQGVATPCSVQRCVNCTFWCPSYVGINLFSSGLRLFCRERVIKKHQQ